MWKPIKSNYFFFRDYETQSLKAEVVQLPGRLMAQFSVASNENKTKNKTQVIHEAVSLSLIAYNCKHLNLGFSGKALLCNSCRKLRIAQPNDCFCLTTLQTTCPDCLNTGKWGIPFWTHKLLSEQKSQELLELRSSAALGQLRPSAGSFNMPSLVCLGKDCSSWGGDMLAHVGTVITWAWALFWWQLHPILRKGWLMPLSPALLQSGRCSRCLVTMLSVTRLNDLYTVENPLMS